VVVSVIGVATPRVVRLARQPRELVAQIAAAPLVEYLAFTLSETTLTAARRMAPWQNMR